MTRSVNQKSSEGKSRPVGDHSRIDTRSVVDIVNHLGEALQPMDNAPFGTGCQFNLLRRRGANLKSVRFVHILRRVVFAVDDFDLDCVDDSGGRRG